MWLLCVVYKEEIAGRYRTHKDDVIIGISSKGKEGEVKSDGRLMAKWSWICEKKGEMTWKKNKETQWNQYNWQHVSREHLDYDSQKGSSRETYTNSFLAGIRNQYEPQNHPLDRDTNSANLPELMKKNEQNRWHHQWCGVNQWCGVKFTSSFCPNMTLSVQCTGLHTRQMTYYSTVEWWWIDSIFNEKCSGKET